MKSFTQFSKASPEDRAKVIKKAIHDSNILQLKTMKNAIVTEKPCSKCGCRFARKDRLNTKINKENSFECTGCGATVEKKTCKKNKDVYDSGC